VSTGEAPPPGRLPTLTEVIDLSGVQSSETWPDERRSLDRRAQERRVVAAAGPPQQAPSTSPAASPLVEEQIAQRVLGELQRQIDLLLEYRLREALAPLLARAADNLVRETRAELASTLHDVVARAVELELARHRAR
jgi:hypothetical protein